MYVFLCIFYYLTNMHMFIYIYLFIFIASVPQTDSETVRCNS